MGVKWIGHRRGQEGIVGIPGRDMSDDEIERRGLDKDWLIETGLYIDERPKRRRSKNGDQETQEDTAR